MIELIAVLVIMTILALIVTPLVMNIIKKARIAADKRSIDAYGRSIELAIASYLLDEGKFPTSISNLTIEYKGDQVVCSTTQLNSDSSVYLTGCVVAGRTVDYTYGTEETVTYDYRIGDQVSYNNVDYYVIEDSVASSSTVTLLKAEPLTVNEVNTYGGVGTEGNHVNKSISNPATASDVNGYGGMAYCSNDMCKMPDQYSYLSGCTTDYSDSDIKYVVDGWKNAQASAATEARLITKDEYQPMIVEETYETPTEPGIKHVLQYDWMYNSNYWYWTMTPYDDSNTDVNYVDDWGGIGSSRVYSYNDGFINVGVVRPVIVLPKSALD